MKNLDFTSQTEIIVFLNNLRKIQEKYFFNDPSGVKPLDKVMKNELENMDQTTGVPIVETQIGKGLGVV